MYAGMQAALGDYVAVMDADLQDPPEYIPLMFQTLKKGEYDCVATRREDRKGEKRIRSFLSASFYKCINRLSKVKIEEGARDFRMMNRKMTDALLSLGEKNRFSKGLFGWVGFKTKWLPYHNVERAAGHDVRHHFHRRCPAPVHGHHGPVSGAGLHGDQRQTNLYLKEFQR